MRQILVALTLLFFTSSALYANDKETIARLDAAWTNWAKSNGIRKGAILVTRNGKPVHKTAIGTDPSATFEMASLSKAVTASCVDGLVRGGRIKYNTRVSGILEGPFGDSRTAEVTIAQLIAHSSGIGPDSTQRSMGNWYGSGQSRHETVTQTALGRPRQNGTPGRYFYNNENYAILGTIIEKVTNQKYANVCARSGMQLSRKTGGFAPWGGWSSTLGGYAAFHSKYFGSRKPNSKAKVSLGGGAYYGMGTLWRSSGSRYNYWHFGKHCFPGRLNAGSFAASWQGIWGVFVAYDICASDTQNGQLDAALAQAVFR